MSFVQPLSHGLRRDSSPSRGALGKTVNFGGIQGQAAGLLLQEHVIAGALGADGGFVQGVKLFQLLPHGRFVHAAQQLFAELYRFVPLDDRQLFRADAAFLGPREPLGRFLLRHAVSPL